MREDMAQVIVERPRLGGGLKYPRAFARSGRPETRSAGRREGMCRPWLYCCLQKGLNENLAPLRRFLRSRVGQHWDRVYSEICQRINRDSAVQLHIWQHLVQYVCTNPYVIDGDVGGYFGSFGWHRFYVDPRTGILREAKRRRRVSRRERAAAERGRLGLDSVVPIDAERCYDRIEGIWYELTLAACPAGRIVYDRRRGGYIEFSPRHGTRTYEGRQVYIEAKRQLNTKEIRRVTALLAKRSEE